MVELLSHDICTTQGEDGVDLLQVDSRLPLVLLENADEHFRVFDLLVLTLIQIAEVVRGRGRHARDVIHACVLASLRIALLEAILIGQLDVRQFDVIVVDQQRRQSFCVVTLECPDLQPNGREVYWQVAHVVFGEDVLHGDEAELHWYGVILDTGGPLLGPTAAGRGRSDGDRLCCNLLGKVTGLFSLTAVHTEPATYVHDTRVTCRHFNIYPFAIHGF